MDGPDYFTAIQQAVSEMLMNFRPEFLDFGTHMLLTMGAISIAYEGYTWMGSSRPTNERLYSLLKKLFTIAIGYSFLAFYAAPVPGLGASLTQLITDTTKHFTTVLGARYVANVFQHFNDLQTRFIAPGALDVVGGLIYLVIIVALTLAKVLAIAVMSFGLIASAVLVLLGPIFVPFFIVPKLDFLFWSWLKALVEYSFVPVVTSAVLLLFEGFVNAVLTWVPKGVTVDKYPVYGLQVILVALTFCWVLWKVPSLTSSMFSGRGGQSGLDYLR
jgi:type IV secretory pathway VirB6-like protein